MTKGLLIQPNGAYEIRDIAGHLDIQAAVESEDVDWSAPGAVTYYCFGHALYGKPRNPLATMLYHETHPTHNPLCGPVLVMGPAKDQEHTDVPQWFVDRFQEFLVGMPQHIIDGLAVPLSQAEQDRFQMEMIANMAKVRQELEAGRAVDVGGLMIGPEDVVGPWAAKNGWASLPAEQEMDDLWNAALGDCGQHRSRG
jgi:hypothetical protein